MIAATSNPLFAQNVRSSAVVVAVEHELRDVAEARPDAADLAPEPAELDRAGPVVDDRRLGERQALEPRRIGQPDRQDADRRLPTITPS